MNENKESPGTKIFIQVAGAVLTAVILYFIGINASGEKAKTPEKETGITTTEVKNEKPNLITTENKKSENSKINNQPTVILENSSPETKTESNGLFSFTGTVVDKESNALAGIEVSWKDKKTVTQADGTFSFQVPNNLKGQDLKVVLSKNGKSCPPIENPNGTVFIFSPN